jgi:glycosyltransferase involved in cell wall biosynthesis
MNPVLLSVIMPVYNGAIYLEQAIESILCQTYEDYEFIIINDGSTDDTAAIIRKYNDARIRYYEQKNQGLPETLNRCIELAQGKYLARQDADDISLPQRFEKQVTFLEDYPECGMVGTWAEIWINEKKTSRIHKHPSDDLTLKFDLLLNNSFVHSSIMIRKAVFNEIGLYTTDKSRQPPEDYELWSRVARKFGIANIPEVLQIYREVPKSESRIKMNHIHDRVMNISRENLSWILGVPTTEKEIIDIVALMNADYHLFSNESKCHNLSQLIIRAADTLSDAHGAPRNILRKHADKYCKYLRNRYLSNKYKRLLAFIRPFVVKARRVSGHTSN